MSSKNLIVLAEDDAFRPAGRFDLLVHDHVPFDDLTGQQRYESRLIQTVTGPEGLCLVLGAGGAGKSSLISWACHHLPATYVPVRVPVAALEDAGDIKVLAGSIIVAAARATALTTEQQTDLARSSADRSRTQWPAGPIDSLALGGGPVPAQINFDLRALHAEYEREGLPIDRLHGLDRLVSIFASHDKYLVLVLEDTDAMAGGAGQQAERFMGSVLVLSRELEAPVIIAVQDRHRGAAYDRLRHAGREIVIPKLADATDALRTIIAKRLTRVELPRVAVDHVVDSDALAALVGIYDDSGGNLRQILAVLQFALDHAVDEQAELLTLPHIRYGIQTARPTG